MLHKFRIMLFSSYNKLLIQPKYRFHAWLSYVWNRVDNDRIKQIGIEQACAEWLMKNGALVKWSNTQDYLTNYNGLQKEIDLGEKNTIEEIDATESSINHIGFDYFNGCKNIKKIKFERCSILDDRAMIKLNLLNHSLNHLIIIRCGNITDQGIKSLSDLSNLHHLELKELVDVQDLKSSIDHISKKLTKCCIIFDNNKINC